MVNILFMLKVFSPFLFCFNYVCYFPDCRNVARHESFQLQKELESKIAGMQESESELKQRLEENQRKHDDLAIEAKVC